MRTIKILIGILFIFLFACGLGGYFLCEANVHPIHKPFDAESMHIGNQLAEGTDSKLDAVEIHASDGTPLKAWYFTPAKHNGNAVIVIHGVSNNRSGMRSYIKLLLLHGYEVLAPDMRDHGESGGTITTYGLLEADDIHRWFDWVKENHHPRCIEGLGESMGAAIMLQSVHAESRFCSAIAECSFASFRKIAYDRIQQLTGCGPALAHSLFRPALDAGFITAKWKYGLDFEQISPEKDAAETKVPILLIHGTADTNVPLHHSREIYAAAQSSGAPVTFWEVDGAKHSASITAVPAEFEKHVFEFYAANEAKTFPQ